MKSRLSRSRYFVPDLSPQQRPELSAVRPRVVFVGESPHVREVEPQAAQERRPLCGPAGKAWWKALGEALEGDVSDDVSLERMLRLCGRHSIAVINAVQLPLDPGITRVLPDADTVKLLGFSKAAGPAHYKRRKAAPEVRAAVALLRERLMHPSVLSAAVHPLGNDAEWFVREALAGDASRIARKLPHPSAWWRRGGWFGQEARKILKEIFAVTAATQ